MGIILARTRGRVQGKDRPETSGEEKAFGGWGPLFENKSTGNGGAGTDSARVKDMGADVGHGAGGGGLVAARLGGGGERGAA